MVTLFCEVGGYVNGKKLWIHHDLAPWKDDTVVSIAAKLIRDKRPGIYKVYDLDTCFSDEPEVIGHGFEIYTETKGKVRWFDEDDNQ